MLRGVASNGANTVNGITSLTGDVTATGPGAAAATLVTNQPGAHTWAATQTFSPAANTSAIVPSYSLSGANAQSLIDIAATWNTTGAPTLIRANVTNTASAGSSLLMDLRVGGSSQFSVSRAGTITAPRIESGSGNLMIGSQLSITGGWTTLRIAGAVLEQEAANVLALRNGSNAQTYRVYNTSSSDTNYERLGVFWSSNVCYITPEAQTGTLRPMVVRHPPVTLATLPSASSAGAGARSIISDATTPTFGNVATGGGSTVIPVYSDGTNWRVG